MLRWLATAVIVALLALDLFLPGTSVGRRGNEARARSDAPAIGQVGQMLPDLSFVDLEERPVRLSDFRGQRVLLTFERSVDW